MNCPYPERNCPQDLPHGATVCPSCRRIVKECARCRELNRAFANFCRACSEGLDATDGNWLGYKGGVRRLGSNAAQRRDPLRKQDVVHTGLTLRLGDVCRSLLGYDGHLVAVAKSGAIEIVDPRRPAAAQRFRVHGPVSAEPCIDRGILYVGAPGQIAAYSIGALTLSAPRSRPLWTVSVGGSPIQALTPVGDRLYATVATEARKEVVFIDNVHEAQPSQPRIVHAARRVSWLAADPTRGEVVFLSEDGGVAQVYVASSARAELASRPLVIDAFSEHPIAWLGGSVFALFEAAEVHRIDPFTGVIDETLGDDTQLFSLTRDEDGEWDRDLVQVESSGVVFARAGVRDSFSHLDRVVKGSPVIVDGRAVAVGMEDGRVLLYDLARLPRHEVWRLDGAAETPITALASFDSFIAAGNRDGVVGVCELRPAAGMS